MLTAAAAAAPLFLPRRVWGANDRVVLAIIGCGQRGNQLAGDMPEGAQIAAVTDAYLKKADSLQQQLGSRVKVYQDYRNLFDRTDLDGVIVTATDLHHVSAGVLACAAGLDAYVEKPLAIYIREGRALVNAARKYNRVVQTGTQQRTMEMDRFACEFVRGGGIGKIHAVECINYTGPIIYPPEGLPAEPIPAGLDWDVWQGHAPSRPFNRRLFSHWTDNQPNWWGNWWAYSNAQMTGLGSHAFDMVQYALGMDETGPAELWPVETGPNARIHFRYANGVEVRLRFPDAQPYRGPRLGAIFTGSECKIEINRNKFTTNPPDFIKNPPDPKLAEKWEGDGWIAQGHIQNWLDCIKTRQRPNADVEIGHRTATVCHLLTITRYLGRRLKWDAAKEIFPGDEEANKLLDRPRRKGWELSSLT
jgi:predicted dehydrogenase